MLCYIYCSLATAYAETMRSVKQERSTSQFSQGCCSVFSRPSELALSRKPCKTGLHENTSPFSAFLELRNSLGLQAGEVFFSRLELNSAGLQGPVP